MPDFKILFVGARIVGHRVLEAILSYGHNVVGLLALAEEKENITVAFKSFDDLVAKHRLNAHLFTSLKSPELVEWARGLGPDVGIVAGVSQLVGEDLLQVPRLGFIGMHPTLLPQGRGRAPIPWAIIKGLKQTGVSLFYCEAGADTGQLLAQEPVPVYYEDTAATLGARTDDVVIKLMLENLPRLAAGTARRVRQDDGIATNWPKRTPEDGKIDWRNSKVELYDWVRALTHPYPGAFTVCRGRRLWIWGARESADERTAAPGEIVDVLPHGVVVATGVGCLLITHVQWQDDKEMRACDAGLKRSERFADV